MQKNKTQTKDTVRRFLRSMGKQKIRLLIVLFSVAAYTVFNILAPLYSASAVDLIWNRIKDVRATGEAFHLTWADGGEQILILLLIYAAAGIFYILQNFLMASFAERLSCQIRSELSEKLHRLPLAYYDRNQAGEVMSHITNDLDKVSEALQTGMIRLFVAVGTVIGSIVMMLRFSVLLTVVFLGFTAFSIFLTSRIAEKTLRFATQRQEAVGRLNGLVEEAYSGRMVIKAFNYEEQSSQKVHEAAEQLARTSEKTDFVMYAVNPGIRLVNRAGMVVIAILGARMLLTGNMTPGIFQAFFQYVNQAGEPITELSYMINSMQSALASMTRVYEMMDEEEMPPSPGLKENAENSAVTDTNRNGDKARGKIVFSHVRFGYTPEKMLMHDVSFETLPGQKIAIVGSTGAGKTTLVNLLMRFYDANDGKILLDDLNTLSMSREELRSRFGMVLQDTWLFEGTIAENIAMESPMQAARKLWQQQRLPVQISLSARCRRAMTQCSRTTQKIFLSDSASF